MIAFEGTRGNPLSTTDRVVHAHGAVPGVARWAWVAACLVACLLASTLDGPLVAQVATGATGALLATAALVDLHEFRLPNSLLATALVTTLVAAAAGGALWRTLLGAVVGGGLVLLVRLARSVGMGDVKMAGVVGAGVAHEQLVAAPLAVAVAALAAAGAGVLLGRTRLPLGPPLWLGWAVALVLPMGRWFA